MTSWPSLTSHLQSGQAHSVTVLVLMVEIHEHALMYLSIVETGFSKQAGRVPENPASPNAKKAPASSKSSPALPKPQEMDDGVCTAHHHHPAALVLKPLALQESQEMAEFFSALADPTRLRLISLLATEECCVCDLAEQLGMTDSAISHQLRTLRGARLVRYRKEGRQVFYRLHDHHVVDLYRTVQEHLAE
jgi:ArsR family transcriptional regulator, lead/cadmium/zinc/bismuth-responsive transcriptional repressor